jgi:hypothetical protein
MQTAIIAVAIMLLATVCRGDDRDRDRNYILRRQQAGQVTGQPTVRRIVGKREFDVYRNGLIFEGDNVVGVEPRR